MRLYKKIALGWSIFCVAGFVLNFLILIFNHFNPPVDFNNLGIEPRLLMVCWIWVGMWVAVAGPNALMYFMTLKGVTKLETNPEDFEEKQN